MTRAAVDSPFIVRAEHRRAYADAEAIVAQAKEDAARMRAEAEVERSAVLQDARSQGLRQAAAEAATLAANTAEVIELFWSEREKELRDVALAVAHRVLADLPADEVMLRLASEAIAEHGRDVRLALRTSPDMADALRIALQARHFGDRVTVVGDPTLTAGNCTLLHPRGRTEVGLLAQFRAMLALQVDREVAEMERQ